MLEQPSGLHQVPPLQPRLPLLLGGDDPARLEEALAGGLPEIKKLSKNVRLVEKQQHHLQSLEQAAKKPRLPQAPTSSSADEPSQETEWHGNKAKVKTLAAR